MMRPLLPLLLAVLLPAVPVAPAQAATPPPAAGALVDSVAAHYGRLTAYDFVGSTRYVVHQDGASASPQNPFDGQPIVGMLHYAARTPAHLRVEVRSSAAAVLLVEDGESLMVCLPTLQQYTVQRAQKLAPGAAPEGEFAALMQPLQELGHLGAGTDSTLDLGPDTVRTAEGAVTCRRVRLVYTPGNSNGRSVSRDRVLWIDPARALVLRDSTSIAALAEGQPAVHARQELRYVRLDDGSGGGDSLYRLVPIEGLQRVEKFGPPPPPQAAMVGKPAKPFTLTGLDGARVALAAQRGKVVVLDFWATWCGPCRRWMPIVAGVEQKLRGHGVRFWAVNVREPAATVRTFLEQTKTTVPVLLDTAGTAADAYGASSIPLTVVIGRDGKVVQVLLGLHTEDDLRAALRQAGVQGA